MKDQKIELPPLPYIQRCDYVGGSYPIGNREDGEFVDYEDHVSAMQAYARQAIAQYCQQQRVNRAKERVAYEHEHGTERLEALDRQRKGEPVPWLDGEPPFPQNQEWFIAETTYGDRVVLCALPEKHRYDYKTADETYLKAGNIKRWMQFPDCEYLPPKPAEPVKIDIEDLAQEIHELASRFSRTSSEPSHYYIDTIGFARALLARYGSKS